MKVLLPDSKYFLFIFCCKNSHLPKLFDMFPVLLVGKFYKSCFEYSVSSSSSFRLDARRCKNSQYPLPERRLFAAVRSCARTLDKSEIIEQAEQMACEIKIKDMNVSNNWCSHFVTQHNLIVDPA